MSRLGRAVWWLVTELAPLKILHTEMIFFFKDLVNFQTTCSSLLRNGMKRPPCLLFPKHWVLLLPFAFCCSLCYGLWSLFLRTNGSTRPLFEWVAPSGWPSNWKWCFPCEIPKLTFSVPHMVSNSFVDCLHNLCHFTVCRVKVSFSWPLGKMLKETHPLHCVGPVGRIGRWNSTSFQVTWINTGVIFHTKVQL